MTDETTPVPTFDPTWLRGDLFALPKDVNDAEDDGEPQRDDVIARLTAERDRARDLAAHLEALLSLIRDSRCPECRGLIDAESATR